MPKEVLIDNDDFTFSYEIIDSLVFLHFDVYTWSKEQYIKLLQYFKRFLDYANGLGVHYVYCLINPEDEKLVKFEEMFGFSKLLTTPAGLIMERSTSDGS